MKMLISARNSKAASNSVTTSDEQAALLQMEDQLPPVLIAHISRELR